MGKGYRYGTTAAMGFACAAHGALVGLMDNHENAPL